MFVSDVSTNIDQPILDAFEELGGEPIKVRLQPAVQRHRPEDGRKQFLSWHRLHWMVTVDNLDEAQALREALTLFFERLKREGVTALREHLKPAPATN